MYSISFFQVSGIGARDLWGTLRNNSQIKLQKEDNMIPPDVKVKVLSYGRGETLTAVMMIRTESTLNGLL